MKNPGNVPPLRDVRFANWDELAPTARQVVALRGLLRSEGIDPGELFGSGFESVEDLSRWSVSWGIDFLTNAQEARYVNEGRARIERDREERLEQAMKAMIAMHFRGRRGA